MRKYSRMKTGVTIKTTFPGRQPSFISTLESYELCCLVETFPDNHEDFEDYVRTKYLSLCKDVSMLGRTHWSDTNRVMLRNRRIGCSVSGVAQFITNRGIDELKEWLNDGYDVIQNGINNIQIGWPKIHSIKTTSVKPMERYSIELKMPIPPHPESRFFIRRIRVSKHSELLEITKKAFVIK